jgi:hypothetical protein
VHHHRDRKLDLAVLKDGDFFGELALVDHGPRSADVIAETDAALLKISQAAIAAVAGVYPTAAFKLLIAVGRLMVDRLRSANQRYVDSLLFPLQERTERGAEGVCRARASCAGAGRCIGLGSRAFSPECSAVSLSPCVFPSLLPGRKFRFPNSSPATRIRSSINSGTTRIGSRSRTRAARPWG